LLCPAQDDDRGFPDDKCQRREPTTVDQIMHSVLHKTGELTGKFIFPITAMGTKACGEYEGSGKFFLLIQPTRDLLIRSYISREAFELYALLLPLTVMLVAVEFHNSGFSEIVPTVPRAKQDIRNVSSTFETDSSRQILHIILARFIAPVLMNNPEEAIYAHLPMLFGREEPRTQQVSYHANRSGLQLSPRRSVRPGLSEG
jgi:hypothetical protein